MSSWSVVYSDCTASSSGKTHTILGNDSQPGIIPRIMEDLFRVAQEETKNGDVKYTVSYSYLEIYNEKVCCIMNILFYRGNEQSSIHWNFLTFQKLW